MNGIARLAGSGTLADGARLVWSVADGRRGRRWRAVASRDGSITHALLLEVDLDGRPSRLELTTTAGMLTLHPDATGRTLHGNVVTADGVRHLGLSWGDEHGLEIEGRPIATAVTAHHLSRSLAVGDEREVPVVAVTADLAVGAAIRRFVRVGETEWRIERVGGTTGAAGAAILSVDVRGVPAGLEGGVEWPLELD